MFKRGVAFVVSLAMGSVALGDVEVQLVPDNPGPYNGGETLMVDIQLVQNDGVTADRSLRMVQFDVSASDIAFAFPPVADFWDFNSTPACMANAADCGINHYIDGARNDSRPCCPNIFAIAYGSATALGEDTSEQLVLPADGTPLTVAQLNVTVPVFDGEYQLDVVNAGESDPDLGAQVRWGFGSNIDGNPLTTWRAGAGLTGGTMNVCVGNACNPCVQANSSIPACDGILSRVANNVIRIQYTANPTAEQLNDIQIRELTDGGFGTDVTAQFTKLNEGGNVVSLTNTGTPIANETWYGVTDGCNDLQFVVVYGDVNGDGETNAFDVNEIWANRTSPPEDSIYDVNGDGAINAFDVNEAWAKRNSVAPAKPAGHVCP